MGLRGEIGVRAVRRIPAGTLLGPYATYVCSKKEYKSRKFLDVPGATRKLPPGQQHTSMHAEVGWCRLNLRASFET